jgi:signal transduction histidine kinase
MKLLFEQKIRLGFSLALVLLLVLAGIGWWSAARSISAFHRVDQTHEILDELDNISIGILNAETTARSFAVNGNEELLKPYQSGLTLVEQSRRQLQQLFRGSPSLAAKLDTLGPLIDRKLSAIAAIIQERRSNGLEAAVKTIASGEGDNPMHEIRNLIAEIQVVERHLLDARSAKAQTEARSAISVVIFGSMLAIGLVALANLLLQRDFRRRLAAETERDRLFAIQKQVEAQIVQLNSDLHLRASQLADANKELEAFSYSVSHDLRAPLRHLSGFVDLLKKNVGESLNPKALHHLNCIGTSARQMGQLVDDLLQFSRMARAEMRPVRVDLQDLLVDVRERLQHDFRGRSIEWNISPLPEVLGDRSMLRIVLTNLVSNAIKYTRPRKPAKIEIGSHINGNEHIVFVRDNGVGFDMKYVGKLFGVFQRLHFEEEFEGTGIGLANVQRILFRHGGRVWAEGKEEEGATFYFALPRIGSAQAALRAPVSSPFPSVNAKPSTINSQPSTVSHG